jgi:hypothetical protein
MGIAVAEGLKKNNPDAIETALEAFYSGGDQIFNMSMLQNIKELMGGNYGSFTEAIAGLPASYVEQAFPAFIGQVAKSIDDTKRSTYDTNPVMSFGKRLASKTPGVSTLLEPQVDVWGKDTKQAPAIAQFISPSTPKGATNDNVTKEVVRLFRQSGDTGMLPKLMGTSFTNKGQDTKLQPKQLTEFQREMGELNYNSAKSIISQQMSDESKIKRLKSIIDRNYETVKKKYIPK